MAENTETKNPIEQRLIDLDREIQNDRTSKDNWAKWRRRFGFVAAIAAGSIILLKAAPIILVMGPTFLVSIGGFIASHFAHKDKEEDLNKKYDQQAKLVIAVETAKSLGPDAENKLEQQISQEFTQVARLSKLEQIVEGLKKSMEGKPASLDKAKPANDKLRL